MKKRDYLALFDAGTTAQLEKLEHHGRKSCWKELSLRELVYLLSEEMLELHEEYYEPVGTFSHIRLRQEAADVANYAHMIIERCNEVIMGGEDVRQK